MKLIIADDDRLVLNSLKTILESDTANTVCACCTNGEEAVKAYLEYAPDAALLDIRMGGKSGLEAAREILERDKDAKIIFLTTFHDTDYIVEALDMGASGYILKQDYEQIIPALNTVMAGGRVLGAEIMNAIPPLISNRSRDLSAYGLDERQQQITEAVSKGLSNKEIAAMLHLSEGTVRNYISAILEILNLRDRTQLAVFYLNL